MGENGKGPGLAESQAVFAQSDGPMSRIEKPDTVERPPPNIFISHRHADFALASTIRDFIEQRAAHAEVFQSSYENGGSSIGKLLNEELGMRLSAAEVVLLLYTATDENWSYCMWEVGVAFNPDCPDTRIIVLQAGSRVPAPLGDRRAVRLASETEVMQFVAQLFTDPELFPKHGKALWPSKAADAAIVRQAGADLWVKLQEHGIREEDDKDWDICRSIVLATTTVFEETLRSRLQSLADAAMGAEREQQVSGLRSELAENLHIETKTDGSGQIFGLHLRPETRLVDIVEAWRRERKVEPIWADMLLDQILRAVESRWPHARYHALLHAVDNQAFLPVLQLVRRRPTAGRVEYHIVLPRFDLDGAVETLALPLSGNPSSPPGASAEG